VEISTVEQVPPTIDDVFMSLVAEQTHDSAALTLAAQPG
jgi:hypothetical protein